MVPVIKYDHDLQRLVPVVYDSIEQAAEHLLSNDLNSIAYEVRGDSSFAIKWWPQGTGEDVYNYVPVENDPEVLKRIDDAFPQYQF